MHRKQAAVIDPRAYSGFANSVVLWIVVIQVMGWGMSRVLAWRVGFDPVWFLDCTACLPRAGAIPIAVPVLGGVSLFVVGSATLAVLISAIRRSQAPGSSYRVLSIGAALLATLYTVVGIDTRYPGSLPGVLVVVLPGAMAAIAYLTAAAASDPASFGPLPRPRLSPESATAAGLGVASMVMLGGLISIVSLSVGIVAWNRAEDPRNRRFAIAGIVLGALSFILRWSLINRYPSILGLFV